MRVNWTCVPLRPEIVIHLENWSGPNWASSFETETVGIERVEIEIFSKLL